MSGEKVLTLRGKKAVWAPGGGTGPIDPNRLPEGYPYKEKGATILDVTHEFPALRQQQFPAENGGLEVGKVYTVTITDPTGNVTKEVAAVDELGEDLGLQVAYNEENYAITIRYKAEENVYSIIDTGDGGQFTITIEAPETIHTMAPEFLPEGYPYKEETYMDNYEGQVTVTIGADGTNTEDMICAVDDGAKYKVTWDGKDYFATAKADEQDADKIYAFRTADGFPFDMYCTFVSGGMPKLIIENAVPGDHTFQIFFVTETVHPMDEEYIQLTSPNGTKYKLSVANDGTLSAVKA